MGPPQLVLVVDDDEDIRAALCAVLEEEGFEAAAVANGREALEYLRRRERPPSTILLDLMMPVMDGWQFRAIQRADPALASIPVVAITASGLSVDAAAQLGVDHCLTKPLQLETLFEAIHTCSLRAVPPAPLSADVKRRLA